MQQTVEAEAQSKRCPSCRKHLPRAAFNLDTSRKNGLQPSCRDCVNEKKRANYLRKTPKERRESGGAARTDNAYLPPTYYGPRNCNNCDKRYRGIGRLLCDACRRLAANASPMAGAVGTGARRNGNWERAS